MKFDHCALRAFLFQMWYLWFQTARFTLRYFQTVAMIFFWRHYVYVSVCQPLFWRMLRKIVLSVWLQTASTAYLNIKKSVKINYLYIFTVTRMLCIIKLTIQEHTLLYNVLQIRTNNYKQNPRRLSQTSVELFSRDVSRRIDCHRHVFSSCYTHLEFFARAHCNCSFSLLPSSCLKNRPHTFL